MKKMKVLLIIVGIIVLLFVTVGIIFSSYAKLNKNALNSDEKILKGNGDKKALVLYQNSKHSTATDITMALAEELNKNGYTVVINHPSSDLTYNIKDFDVFAFGSAVYMGEISEPLKDYMDKATLEGKKVMVYAVGMFTDDLSEVNMMKEKVKGASALDGIKVKKGEEEKIKTFASDFLKNNSNK